MPLETIDLLFSIANGVAILAWITLAILYDHPLTKKIILNGFVFGFATLYAILVFFSFDYLTGGNGLTLKNTMALFSHPIIMLLGWVHYLAFDLAIGLFITFNAAKHEINRFLLLPILLFTFLLGPFGFFLYLILLAIKQKTPLPTFF